MRGQRERSWEGRRDAIIALALAGLAIGFIVAAVASGSGREGQLSGAGEPRLPPGWQAIDRPLTAVTYPRQVFAASTYPVVPRHRPRSCTPTAALDQMPAGGILLQMIEYAPTAPSGKRLRVPELPPRPARFAWSDATHGRFECAGPSYKFDYRQDSRALQAQVWIDPAADPRSRAGALRILDRFEPSGP
jgi:hypothetical protein